MANDISALSLSQQGNLELLSANHENLLITFHANSDNLIASQDNLEIQSLQEERSELIADIANNEQSAAVVSS